MDFSRDFYWHDAVIKSVIIDRNDPGVVDEIWVDVVCPTENEKGIIQRVVFESVLTNPSIISAAIISAPFQINLQLLIHL